LAKVGDEAAEIRFFRGFVRGCSLSGHGGLAGEDELRDVSESDGVPAGDALAGELPDEIAEEEIHLVGSGETVDVVEKLGGEDFRIDNGDGTAEKPWASRPPATIPRGSPPASRMNVTPGANHRRQSSVVLANSRS
jgi:hypothetical protein